MPSTFSTILDILKKVGEARSPRPATGPTTGPAPSPRPTQPASGLPAPAGGLPTSTKLPSGLPRLPSSLPRPSAPRKSATTGTTSAPAAPQLPGATAVTLSEALGHVTRSINAIAESWDNVTAPGMSRIAGSSAPSSREVLPVHRASTAGAFAMYGSQWTDTHDETTPPLAILQEVEEEVTVGGTKIPLVVTQPDTQRFAFRREYAKVPLEMGVIVHRFYARLEHASAGIAPVPLTTSAGLERERRGTPARGSGVQVGPKGDPARVTTIGGYEIRGVDVKSDPALKEEAAQVLELVRSRRVP